MPLFDDAGNIPSTQLTRPGQLDQTGDINATAVTEYQAEVEHTAERRSVLAPYIPLRPVRGTNSIGNFGFGKSTIGKVVPGEAFPATKNDVGRVKLVIDTLIGTRHTIPLLEEFHTSYEARTELAIEDGTEQAQFFDQAFFIQAAKASLATNSPYSATSGKPAGFYGGSKVTLADAGDKLDPARMYQAISDLIVAMKLKNVNPALDDVVIAVDPIVFHVLLSAEQLINQNYVTSRGTQIEGAMLLKGFGCPIVETNNLPNTNITGHHLSTTNNSNAYDGDFTKLLATAVSPKAFLAGETIPLSSDVFYDKIYKTWFVDSHRSFGVTPNRTEYAGSIWLP